MVLSVYIRTFCHEKSEMPKLSKARRANQQNAKKGRDHLNCTKSNDQNEEQSDDNYSDEDFFIIREKDILTVTSMSKEVTFLYEAFLLGDNLDKKDTTKIDPEPEMGYLGKINEARNLFERIYKS